MVGCLHVAKGPAAELISTAEAGEDSVYLLRPSFAVRFSIDTHLGNRGGEVSRRFRGPSFLTLRGPIQPRRSNCSPVCDASAVSMALYFSRFTSLLAVVTLLVTISLLATKGLNFAVEFAGGMIIEVHYPEAVTSKSVQDTLVRAGLADASVKEIIREPSHFVIVFPLREEVLSPQSGPHVLQQVIAAFSTEQSRVEALRVVIVPPKLGGEVLLFGPVPMILVCVVIMIYPAVRYGWRVGLSVALTSVRNMVITLGLFLSTYSVFQWDFSLTSMLAMDALAILATGASTVYALRADQWR